MTPQPVADAYRGPDRRDAAPVASCGYQGPDRRQRAPIAADGPVSRIWYVVLALSLLVVSGVGVRAVVVGGRGRVVTYAALRDSSAGLLVLTGTVLLVLWALRGRARKARDGAALLFAGGGLLIFAGPWGALMHHSQTATLISPGARLVVGLPALVMLLRPGAAEPVDSRMRPARVLATIGTCALALVALETVVRLWGPVERPVVLAASMIVLGVGWIAAGAARLSWRWRHDAELGRAAFAWSLALFGVGDLFLAMAFGLDLRWAVLGAATQLLASVVLTKLAVTTLVAVLRREGNHQLQLVGELSEVSGVLEDAKSERRRLIHDARNVVAAIGTATMTLERKGEQIDPALRAQLQGMVGSEIERLQELLAPRTDRTGYPDSRSLGA